MPSKPKPADSRRASLPRACDFEKAFVKDWQRLDRAGRFDMRRLKQAMLLLVANEGLMAPEWLDHPLKGEWEDHRECHIGGDFLLIYRVQGAIIRFVRAGTHAELFE